MRPDHTSVEIEVPSAAEPQPASQPGLLDAELGEVLFPILMAVWRWRWLLAKGAIAGLVVAGLLYLVNPPKYQAVGQLMPPDQKNAALTLLMGGTSGPLDAGLGLGDVGMRSPSAVFVKILGSKELQRRMVQRFNLTGVYGTTSVEKASKILEARTTIKEDDRSGVITFTYADSDPLRAVVVANGYIEELEKQAAGLNTSAASREREFLERRLKSVREEMATAAEEFSRWSSKTSTIDPKEQGKAMVETIGVLQGALVQAEAELKELSQRYTDSNVRVRALKARIAELRRQIANLGFNPEGGSPVSKSAAGNGYPTIRQLPILGVTYAEMLQRLTVLEQVYETLAKQYELARVQEAKESLSVRVLDRPDIPETRSGIGFLPTLAVGSLLGATLAFAWALGREQFSALEASSPWKMLGTHIEDRFQRKLPAERNDAS